MSLDVWLTIPCAISNLAKDNRIFIRENGSNREISRQEWYEKYPDRVPVEVAPLPENDGTETVFEYNVTHNLGEMAAQAELYKPLWRPEEIGITTAAQLIEPLQKGLNLLKGNAGYYREFNPKNGWGSYDGLLKFVEEYLEACKEFPTALVSVSR